MREGEPFFCPGHTGKKYKFNVIRSKHIMLYTCNSISALIPFK
jgi:hypothetical protein